MGRQREARPFFCPQMEPQQLRMNDNEFDAIGDDLKAIGGVKAASGLFFPTRTPDQGAATLRAWAGPFEFPLFVVTGAPPKVWRLKAGRWFSL